MLALPANQPVTVAPLLAVDQNDTPYAFFGTGRILASADVISTAQQAIYSVKDLTETSTPSNCGGASAGLIQQPSQFKQYRRHFNWTVTGGPTSTYSSLQTLAATNCAEVGSPASMPSPCYDGWHAN